MDVIFLCNNCNWRLEAIYVGLFTRFTRSHRLLEINKYGFAAYLLENTILVLSRS